MSYAAAVAAPMSAFILSAKNPIAVAGQIPSFGKLPCPCPSSRSRQIILMRRGGHCKASRRRVQKIGSARAQSSRSSSSGSSSARSPTTSVDADGEEEEAERARKSLKDLSETLALPSGFLSNLPNDLRVDLNDAAFALSSGPVNIECGEKVGRLLLALSRAWEQADTQAVEAIAKEAPFLQDYLPSDPSSSAALGKRLQSAGKYLRSTGNYGQGELKKVATALVAAGEALSSGKPDPVGKSLPQDDARVLKFGSLQVQLTSQNAYIGAATALGFGTLCWLLTSSFNSIPVNSSQYANDSSFAFASSLRGTLLTAGYFCTALSAFIMVGLLVLAPQLGSSSDKSS